MLLVETNAVVGGKHLTFKLADEEYGLPIVKVQEIIQRQEITRVPRLPDFVSGVINLRGKVIPVLDLRRRFGLPSQAATARTCIVILQAPGATGWMSTGLMVDEVTEVVEIPSASVEPPPELGARVNLAFVAGVAQVGARVILLLRIDKILDSREWSTVEKIAQAEQENSHA